MSITEKRRAGFYVDGFNLYHALDDLAKPYLKWLSLQRLADRIARQAHVEAKEVVFCTAYFPKDFSKKKRHEEYVRALEAETVKVLLGHTTIEPAECLRCSARWNQPREKQTDINLALSAFQAAVSGSVDTVFIISNDTDQVATVNFIREHAPAVEVVTLTPPGRPTASHLKDKAHRVVKISENDLDLSVLPAMIQPKTGRLIVRPKEYAPPEGWLHPDDRRKA